MSDLRTAALQALEAYDKGLPMTAAAAMSALRAALEQPEQSFLVTRCMLFGDPPAPHQSWHDFFDHAIQTRTLADVCVSTSPRREWRGLTEEEIWLAARPCYTAYGLGVNSVARAIEAALKERNT